MLTINEYKTAIEQYMKTKDDSVLYPISDAIDKMDYDVIIEFREQVKAVGLPILPNLTYDYENQTWITLQNGKLFK